MDRFTTKQTILLNNTDCFSSRRSFLSRIEAQNGDQDFKMSGFVIRFASVMCLLVILTGPSSALFWRPTPPTYPNNPNDPYYQAFQSVPSPNVTAKKLITSFLGYTQSPSVTAKRQTLTYTEDIVIVLDGSGSVGLCEFKKGKEALKHMMKTAHNPQYETKYAAVTFSNTATVDFMFLPYVTASGEITKITYPGGSTNTQAGLAEAKKLFVDPNSGGHPFPTRKMVFLLTDGKSNVQTSLTEPNASALKSIGVEIFVVAVGNYIAGIEEMVRVASYPPKNYLFRVKSLQGFWEIIKLTVKLVSPGNYHVVDYDLPC